jgi:crossover junction endodeoxyribonuclease RuvC
VRVIGIDPGVAVTGYAVVERVGSRTRALDVGIVRTRPGAQAQRLLELEDGIDKVLVRHRPDAAAVERVFFNANVRTAMAVGQASGVALAAAARREIEVVDYTPLEVKLSVVGYGAATKHQVQTMVARLLGLARAPAPPDAADACALAICHLSRGALRDAVDRALA